MVGPLLVMTVVVACPRSEPHDRSTVVPAAIGPPLRVEFGGCQEVFDGPICETEDRVSVWVQTSSTAVVDLGLVGLETTSARWIHGGRTHILTLTASTGQVRIEAADGAAVSRFRLAVRRPQVDTEPTPSIDAVVAATNESDRRAALLAISEKKMRAWALDYLARRTKAPLERKLDWLTRAEAIHREGGFVSRAHEARALRAQLLMREERFTDARETLAPLRPAAGGNPWERYQAWWSLGAVARESGDANASYGHYERVHRMAERIGGPDLRAWSTLSLAQAHQLLGRWQAALRLSNEALALLPQTARCARPAHLHNMAWIELLRREADPFRIVASGIEPRRLLDRSFHDFDDCQYWGGEEASLMLDYALADLQAGRPGGASDFIDRAERAGIDPRHRAWAQHLEGRAALAQRKYEAARGVFTRLLTTARAVLDPTKQWWALVGRGQAYEGLGEDERAREDYERAEALLDDRVVELSLGAGRADFAAVRGRSARLLTDLLARTGRLEAAVMVGRRSRARPLRTAGLLEQISGLPESRRRAWEDSVGAYIRLRRALDQDTARDAGRARSALAAARAARRVRQTQIDRLLQRVIGLMQRPLEPAVSAPLPAGVLGLLVHPGRSGWWVFAFDRDRTEARAIPARTLIDGNPEAVSAAVLGPFAARIDAARELRLFLHDWPRGLDLHALSLDGAPLLSRVPVTYGLDLPPVPASDEGPRSVLLVSDPRADLPAARREGRRLAARMPPRGAKVVYLEGDAATAQAVRAALPEATALHFAGHARVNADRFDSSLLLANGERLTVGDVLVLNRVPATAVLSGCETARAPAKTVREVDLGIAQAFLLRGARRVLATTRPVADGIAEAVSVALHESAEVDAPAAARALRRVAARYPGADWAAYRLYVR